MEIKKAKIVITDIDGTVWEKEGDATFGVAVFRHESGFPTVKVDFSTCTKEDIMFGLASMLVVAAKKDRIMAAQAITLAVNQINEIEKNENAN
jgi:enoyl reductase-like protein